MRLRDKEKNLLVELLSKTAEFVLALVVLGSVISDDFQLTFFLVGLIVYFGMICSVLLISSTTKEDN